MKDENKFWTMQWTQPYASWPKPALKSEPELEDLTQARLVLARIMSK